MNMQEKRTLNAFKSVFIRVSNGRFNPYERPLKGKQQQQGAAVDNKTVYLFKDA